MERGGGAAWRRTRTCGVELRPRLVEVAEETGDDGGRGGGRGRVAAGAEEARRGGGGGKTVAPQARRGGGGESGVAAGGQRRPREVEAEQRSHGRLASGGGVALTGGLEEGGVEGMRPVRGKFRFDQIPSKFELIF